MTLPKTFALIGVGGHGRSHLHVIRSFEAHGAARLVAVADPFVDKLAECHDELTRAGVHWHRDYRELLARESGLDVVVISTPIHLHDVMVQDVLTQTKARILLEKPPFPTIQQLDRFIALDPESRVRVGFQMIHFPGVRTLKKWLADGAAGTVRRITISAGWPRGTGYYERAAWAGRMMLKGQPVFDGPATNALSHLLHEALFFAGETGSALFGVPVEVTAQLCRARRIESYDAIWLRADLGAIELHIALAHCVRDNQSYRIQVETDRGIAVVQQDEPHMTNTMGLKLSRPFLPPEGTYGLYDVLFHDEAGFRQEPTRLSDMRGYTLLTDAALLSSGGIHDIPEAQIHRPTEGENPDEAYDVRGLREYLATFCERPRSFAEAGFTWGMDGKKIDCTTLKSIDLSAFVPPATS